VIEPARSAVTEIDVALANAGSLFSDYLLTREPQLLERYERAMQDRSNATSRLATEVERPGPGARERLRSLELSRCQASSGLSGCSSRRFRARRP
jgi:CHASE3 domain sensor protein